MDDALLNNVFWSALTTDQAHLAVGEGKAKRFPSSVAPFLTLKEDSEQAQVDAKEIVEAGEHLVTVGPFHVRGDGWRLEKESEVVQMVFNGATLPTAYEVTALGPADLPAMLELIALVYPAYFRPETAALGQYVGIWQEGQLAAMAGERLRFTGYQEISAVCTHPNFQGRGYAKALVSALVNQIILRDRIPMLHFDEGNDVAEAVYTKLGFQRRAVLGLRSWIRI